MKCGCFIPTELEGDYFRRDRHSFLKSVYIQKNRDALTMVKDVVL